MDASVRILALDRYSGRLARIAANYATVVSVCIGALGAAVVLVADAVVWSPIVLSLAFGGFMFTYVRVRSRLRYSVLDFISQFPVRNGFASMALSYLGYTTRYVSDRAIIVEGEVPWMQMTSRTRSAPRQRTGSIPWLQLKAGSGLATSRRRPAR